MLKCVLCACAIVRDVQLARQQRDECVQRACEDVCTCASVKSECVKTGKMRQRRHERRSKPAKTINFLRENKEIEKLAKPCRKSKSQNLKR